MNYEFDASDYHEDERAQRFLNVFDSLDGQVNISYVNSTSHVVAWHRHKIQTDFWFCVKGSFKVGLAKDVNDFEFEYISDKYSRVLEIPPGIWHGYKALEPNSIMLYYLTEKYNPKDEWKCAVGAFNEKWETENR